MPAPIALDTLPVADDAARRAALDISRSVLIQAPAGSGKTELLSQRLLALLGQSVQRPEEIVAITFTRKAAAEMRHRLLARLAWAREVLAGRAPAPETPHERNTLKLAEAALAADTRGEWGLLENPASLRILTIDAFCASLTRQMPLLARLGQQPDTTDKAGELFVEAARRALLALDEDGAEADAVATVLTHLGNNMGQLEELLAGMLAQRDQWLRQLAGAWDDPAQARAVLQRALATVVTAQLGPLTRHYGSRLSSIAALARYAAGNVLRRGAESGAAPKNAPAWHALAGWDGTLAGTPADIPLWSALRDLLLTTSDTLRKKVDSRCGFPAGPKDAGFEAGRKEAVTDFLASCADDEDFVAALCTAAALPPTAYAEEEWQVIEALLVLLRRALAELFLVFQEHGQVDFGELQSRALLALGDEDAPTELARSLDYQIRHLLVDEFQDTSQGQFELITRLTRGWTAGEGRTLFLVGDPMQSIYRFREADVGLFLKARQEGIGGLPLHFLALTVNFRSRQQVVDWVNGAFAQIFPAADDMTLGAIRYSAAVPFRAALPAAGVFVHPHYGNDAAAEAATVQRLVAEARAADPDGSIAILVRSKSHVAAIAAALAEAGQPYRAVDIDALADRPLVQDLLILTRALLHPADRVHWLALLRAPLCGLTLADLHALAGRRKGWSIPSLLADEELLATLSEDGRYRAGRVARVTARLLAERGRLRLRPLVESAWWQLGGELLLRSDTERADLDTVLRLLDELDRNEFVDLDRLHAETEGLFAAPEPAGTGVVEIMSMHKSKGLEFDTVILPGLGRAPMSDRERLLNWETVLLPADERALLLAPIKHALLDRHPLNSYLADIRKQKEEHEARRVLYVAATRARKALHLVGHASISKDGDLSPAGRSLLAHAWPAVKAVFEAGQPEAAPAAVDTDENAWDEIPVPPLRRLPRAALEALDSTPADSEPTPPEVMAAASGNDAPRIRGIVLHRLIQQIGDDGLAHWPVEALPRRRALVERLLRQEGLRQETGAHADAILKTLADCLQHDTFRWIFDTTHQDARNEWTLLEQTAEGLQQHRLDRSFRDAHGVRWIVDYKTGEAGSEALYREQLGRYARLLRAMGDTSLKGMIFDAHAGRALEVPVE